MNKIINVTAAVVISFAWSPLALTQTTSAGQQLAQTPTSPKAQSPSSSPSSAKEPANATGKAAKAKQEEEGGLNLSPEQRDQIRAWLGSQPAEDAPGGFKPTVGATVPKDMDVSNMPIAISSRIPQVKDYLFVTMGDKVLFVDRSSRSIVAIVSK